MKMTLVLLILVISQLSAASENCNIFVDSYHAEDRETITKYLIKKKGYTFAETESEADYLVSASSMCYPGGGMCEAVIRIQFLPGFKGVTIAKRSGDSIIEGLMGVSTKKAIKEAMKDIPKCKDLNKWKKAYDTIKANSPAFPYN